MSTIRYNVLAGLFDGYMVPKRHIGSHVVRWLTVRANGPAGALDTYTASLA